MADKELRSMNRMELIEIIYALKQNTAALEKENRDLKEKYNARQEILNSAESVAEASVRMHDLRQDAIAAAKDYLTSLHANHADEEKQMNELKEKIREEFNATIAAAEKQAGIITEQTEMLNKECASRVQQKVASINAETDEAYAKIQEECSILRTEAKKYEDQQWSDYKVKAENSLKDNKDVQLMLRFSRLIAKLSSDDFEL